MRILNKLFTKKKSRNNIESFFKHSIACSAIKRHFFSHRKFLVKTAYPQEVMKKITPWSHVPQINSSSKTSTAPKDVGSRQEESIEKLIKRPRLDGNMFANNILSKNTAKRNMSSAVCASSMYSRLCMKMLFFLFLRTCVMPHMLCISCGIPFPV